MRNEDRKRCYARHSRHQRSGRHCGVMGQKAGSISGIALADCPTVWTFTGFSPERRTRTAGVVQGDGKPELWRL
jgi:hypothetical protein